MTTATTSKITPPSQVNAEDPTIAAKKDHEQRKLDSLLSKQDALELSQTSANKMHSSPSNDTIPDDGTGVVHLDPWLGPWKDEIRHRHQKALEWIDKFNKSEGGLDQFSKVSLINEH